MISDKDGLHRNPNDIERRDKSDRYDYGNHNQGMRHEAVIKAKSSIENSYWDAVEHFGKENADLALREFIDDKDI